MELRPAIAPGNGGRALLYGSDWFLANPRRYDTYDRSGPKVYLGEYASRGNTLYNALAEAAYMAALERNGDVVRLASYAPLLAKTGHTQWNRTSSTSITPRSC